MLRAAGTTYDPTPTDALWLARAVAAEGPPALGVARALVSGYMWARARRGVTYSLGDWVRRYSQPINPRWLPGGELYEQRLARARRRSEADAERERRRGRRRVAASERTEFPAHVEAAVERALASGTSSPVTDFAAWWARPNARRYPLGQAPRGENQMYTRDRSWRGYRGMGLERSGELMARAFGADGGGDGDDDGSGSGGGGGGAAAIAAACIALLMVMT